MTRKIKFRSNRNSLFYRIIYLLKLLEYWSGCFRLVSPVKTVNISCQAPPGNWYKLPLRNKFEI